MLENIPVNQIERFLTKNQIDTIKLRYDIINRIDPSKNLAKQYREIAKEYTENGIPITDKLVQHYYYKYL